MFTVVKSSQYTNNTVLINGACLAADTKPTTGIANGSMCLEIDTGKLYAYNEDDGEWVEQPGAGGGGGSGSDRVIIVADSDGTINYSFNELLNYVNNGYLIYFNNSQDFEYSRIPLTSLEGDDGDYVAHFGNMAFVQTDGDAPMNAD